jgi:hypothetical protein
VHVIDVAVLRIQVDLQDMFMFARQVGDRLVLGAAQEQGPDPPTQLGQALIVPLIFDRPGEIVEEPVRAGEQPRRR